jgi:hypothetical protein
MSIALLPPLRGYHRGLMMVYVDIGLVARHAHGLIVACVVGHYPGAATNYDRVCLLNLARLYLDGRPMPYVFDILRQRIIIAIKIP